MTAETPPSPVRAPWRDERRTDVQSPTPGAPVALCAFCEGVVRAFMERHPYEDRDALTRARLSGCCDYWTARGIPTGWWV